MSMRREYDAETKAAVMAALLTGQSISYVAKEYSIPEGTIACWSANMRRGTGQSVAYEKRERLGELLVDYLETSLQTLRAQVKFFADEAWLRKQPASELAVLHGVCADKAIRLLEALGKDEAEPDVP
jgi:transposase-like protein